jgi:hypothetical protein
VIAAETESTTSVDERLGVVEDALDFGPENVGDHYFPDKESNTIDAARSLVTLHQPEFKSCDSPVHFSLIPS